jgi:SAM-dependent methyltransferase
MCHWTCITFAAEQLDESSVQGKRVLDVGSRDVNGSVRSTVEALGPAEYLGVDIQDGPGVDELCAVGDLVEHFGPESFDVVISTEMIEHVRDWRGAIENLKAVLKPEGTLFVTTRSIGFHFHGYPSDYWRYEPEDFEAIFSDFDDRVIDTDAVAPGVFIKATKSGRHTDLSDIALHSVVVNRRAPDITDAEDWTLRLDPK